MNYNNDINAFVQTMIEEHLEICKKDDVEEYNKFVIMIKRGHSRQLYEWVMEQIEDHEMIKNEFLKTAVFKEVRRCLCFKSYADVDNGLAIENIQSNLADGCY